YRKEQGRLMLWLIQTFISDGRLIRIGGPENASYVPLVHDPNIGEYDCIVADAPTSPNMKERVWNALIQLFPVLARLNLPPLAIVEALKYSPLPEALVEKLTSMLSQPQGADPAVQGQLMARAQLDQAKAGERVAAARHLDAKSAALQAETQVNV